MKTFIAALVLVMVSSASAETTISLSLRGGSLLHVGDSKVEVLEKLGFPEMQQGGSFFYTIDGRLVQLIFSGEKLVEINRSAK